MRNICLADAGGRHGVTIVVTIAEILEQSKAIGARTVSITGHAASVQVRLVFCGDPVVARPMALVLRGSHYDARFLLVCPLGESGSLDDV